MSKRTKRIGRYEPVRFMQQASARTADSFRERTEVETEYIRRDALVLELRGTEKPVGGQLESDATHLVYMHSDTAAMALTTRNWILRTTRGNARLDILWIRGVGTDGMELELQCNERAEP